MTARLFLLLLPLTLSCAKSGSPGAAGADQGPAREVSGPWTNGSYITLATDMWDQVHVAWVEDESLLYATSSDQGGTWTHPEMLVPWVDTGDAGQIRPELLQLEEGMGIAYGSKKRPWLGVRYGTGWDHQLLATAEHGFANLVDIASVEGQPLVAWLDTRRAPTSATTDVYAWWNGQEELVYQDDGDGVCMCCRPAAGTMGGRPAVAFRDADGALREIRLFVREIEGWQDRGLVTTGGWSPGGCPTDGPVFDGDQLLSSDARDGTRRVYQGDTLLSGTGDSQVSQPRVVDDVRTWVEAEGDEVRLVSGRRVLVQSYGRMEPGDPVRVGNEIWQPWQGMRGQVIAFSP